MQKQVGYSDAVKTKYPEQVIIAVAKDKNGKANPVTLGWTMIASGQPPMMAIAVAATHYSIECIRHSKCFTIAFPSSEMADAALFFGSKSGRDTDKLAEAGANTSPAAQIDCVLLADAVANFECKLAGELETGDHYVLAGEIVCSHANTAKLNRLYTVGKGYKMAGLAGQ